MSLGNKLRYNKDIITVWEKHPTTQKDEYGRPQELYIKRVLKGRWINKIKIMRNLKGEEVTSTAMLVLTFFPEETDLFLFERGESKEEVPSNSSKKLVGIEEVGKLRGENSEWIIYI